VNYSASKAGVIGFTRSLSMELGKFGVTANCIAPGIIATPGVTSLPHYDRLVERVAPTLPIPRLGKPEDVAGVAAFLASDDAEYIPGKPIHVPGGRYGSWGGGGSPGANPVGSGTGAPGPPAAAELVSPAAHPHEPGQRGGTLP